MKTQLGRNVEVYVDDMIIKNFKGGSYLQDLQETFATLSSYGLKLNPAKCTFGVWSGKFLDFIMKERGIEANPEKIIALMHLRELRCIMDVQRINRCITALGRFISKATERCLPFFKVLKIVVRNFVWIKECKEVWEKLREYLMNLPLLSSQELGEILYLYVAASDLAIAPVLIREVDKKNYWSIM